MSKKRKKPLPGRVVQLRVHVKRPDSDSRTVFWLDIKEGCVVRADPYLNYMLGWHRNRIMRFCHAKQWGAVDIYAEENKHD